MRSMFDYEFTDQKLYVNRFKFLDHGIPLGKIQPEKYTGDPCMANGKSYGPTLSLYATRRETRVGALTPSSYYLRENLCLYMD